MKIVGISGSLRNDSYNTRALNYVKEILPSDAVFKIVSIDAPLFNEDIKISEDLIERQKEIASADYIIIASPEYNHSIPGALKNFLDWMSIEPLYPFDEKKVAIMSASISFLGGARMQYHLRQVLSSLNSYVINIPEVFIPSATDKFDGNGLIDEKAKKNIKKLIDELLK